MRRTSLVVAFFVAALASAQSGAQDVSPPADARPMVAVAVPLTGDYAGLGERALRVVEMSGALFPSVRWQAYDTAGEGGAVAALAAAIEDGAIAMLGPMGYQESQALVETELVNELPIFLLTSAGSLEEAGDNVFRLRTTAGDQAEALGGAIASNYDWETFAVFAPDDDYGLDAIEGFVRGVAHGGGTVVRVVEYEAGEPDVTDAALALVGRRTLRLDVPSNPWRSPPETRLSRERGERSEPDVVFVPDYAPQVASVLPFLQFHGWLEEDLDDSVQLLGTAGWAGYELQFVGDLAVGALISQVFNADDPRSTVEAFTIAYEDRYMELPLDFDAQIYDAAGFVMSTVAALPRGTQSARGVLTMLYELDAYEGVCGEMWLDANGGVVREIGLWEVDSAGYTYPIGTIQPPGG